VNVALDLTAIVERLRAELGDEIRAQVRAEIEAAAWPAWMSIETAARYLDCTPERIRKLIARRSIPFSQEAPGCRIFLSKTDLDEWMRGDLRLATAEATRRERPLERTPATPLHPHAAIPGGDA
jgi:excisionase family DNA binding protein